MSAFNNSVCFSLQTSCFSACEATAGACDHLSGELAEGIAPLSYACIAVGTLYVIKGTSTAAVISLEKIKSWLENRKASRDAASLNNFDESSLLLSTSTPPPLSKKITPLWKSVFGVVHSYTVGALPLTAGALLHYIPHFIRSLGCESARNQCPEFGVLCLNACVKGNDWLIEALNEFVRQYMHGTMPP